MSNLQSQMSPRVPTYLPLSDAAKKYGLSEKVLTQMVQAGKIEAVQLPTGDLLVAAENNSHKFQTKEEIIAKDYHHLQGRWITISEASEKYHIAGPTIRKWIKNEYLNIVNPEDYPIKLDEAEVAYCAKVYHEQGGKPGMRIFDEVGQPYRLKHPKLSVYRQHKRRQLEKA